MTIELPVLVFTFNAGRITWRVGDPYVVRYDDDDGRERMFTDWWRAWRDGAECVQITPTQEARRVLSLISDAGRFYGGCSDYEHLHLMEHLLGCAQGLEWAHSVHRSRGGYGPFWYTVWCALSGLPIPTPPQHRGCCYPIDPYGPSECCEVCWREIAAAEPPTYPL
jgi:hypothetical protein